MRSATFPVTTYAHGVSIETIDPRPEPFETGPVRYRWTFTEMLVSSVIGLVAALVLSIEAIALATDPFADLSCNINTVLSCGTMPTRARSAESDVCSTGTPSTRTTPEVVS